MSERLLPAWVTDAIKDDLDRPRWLDQFATDAPETPASGPVSDDQPVEVPVEVQP